MKNRSTRVLITLLAIVGVTVFGCSVAFGASSPDSEYGIKSVYSPEKSGFESDGFEGGGFESKGFEGNGFGNEDGFKSDYEEDANREFGSKPKKEVGSFTDILNTAMSIDGIEDVAKQGDANAQLALANQYYLKILFKNELELKNTAYMWFLIAKLNGAVDRNSTLRLLDMKMSKEERKEAKLLAKRCLESNYLDCGP